MQWTHTCILLASIAIISASQHEHRTKRDLSFFKKLVMSKIFGSHEKHTTPLSPKPVNYRLFKIPGFDNVLVKAVPKVPVGTETDESAQNEVDVSSQETDNVPVNPSIAIVSKYLGTSTLNDTVSALQRVKDLLQSGVLNAHRENENTTDIYQGLPLMIVESSEASMTGAQTPMLGPIPFPRKPNSAIPSQYLYKQVSSEGVTYYTADGNKKVTVKEPKRPVPLPPTVGYRIQEMLLGAYRFPTTPVREMIVKSPTAFESSRYTCNEGHNDGSVKTYTASGNIENNSGSTYFMTEPKKPSISVVAEVDNGHTMRVPNSVYYGFGGEETAVVITEPGRPTVVVSDLDGPPAQFPVFTPTKMPSKSGYSYKQIHKDGSVSTYSGSGHVLDGNTPDMVITQTERPGVVISEIEGPLAPIPVFYPIKTPSSSRYSYNQIHNDGYMTMYSEAGPDVEGEKPAVVITKPGRPTLVVGNVQGPSAPLPVLPKVKVPSISGYSYNQVNKDGSVTTYSGSGHVAAGEKSTVVITEPGRPTLIVPDIAGPAAPVPILYPTSVKLPSSSGYTYNHVHRDGSFTTYSKPGRVDVLREKKPALLVTEPGRPTVVVPDKPRIPAPIPVLPPKKPNSGYSYNHVHNDGTITTFSGSGHVEEHRQKPAVVITEPGRPTMFVPDVYPSVLFPPKVKAPTSSGYSYNHINGDGSVTTYSGSGHVEEHGRKKPALVITEPGRPAMVVPDVAGPLAPSPIFYQQKVESSLNPEYSYNHVHGDGSVTTYSGSGIVREHRRERPSLIVTEPGRPTVVADMPGPPAPIPVRNGPMGKVPSSSGYLYNQVHADGSMTTHTGSGQVVEHEGEKSAVLITEHSRPADVVSEIEGQASRPVFAPKVPSTSGFSYNHVHDDGTVTTYSGSAQIPFNPQIPPSSGFSYNYVHGDGSITTYSGSGDVEQEGKRPAVVMTESGRPTTVITGVDGPPAPFPIPYPHIKRGPYNPSYSYNQVQNDGSLTTFSGFGHITEARKGEKSGVVVTETRQPLPLPTFLSNRLENAAAAALAVSPVSNYYGSPMSVFHEHSVIVEDRPDHDYYGSQNPHEMPHHPLDHHFGELTHLRPSSNDHSRFSYQTVHKNGSVTSHTDAEVVAGAHILHDRPMLYPTGPAERHNSDDCENSTHVHNTVNKKEHSNTYAASNLNKFSYTMISEGGSTTKYSSSGNVEHNAVNNAVNAQVRPMLDPPILVTETDDVNPETVLLTPIISQYSYKQINHHAKPDEFTVVNVGNVAIDDKQANKGAFAVPGSLDLPSVEVSKVPKEYVFVPPSTAEEPVPTIKPVVSSAKAEEPVLNTLKTPTISTKSSTSTKRKKVYKYRVRTSTSSSRDLKTSAPLATTPKVPQDIVTSSEGSLAANPIVVLPDEKVFSFKQERADGSSITVEANTENKVSVVEESKLSHNRGDIPDTSY